MFDRDKILTRSQVNWQEYEAFYAGEFEPVLPSNPNWRHWRVRSADGVFRKWPYTVKNKADLVKMANSLCAIDIYYSTSQWLNPKHKASTKTSGRKGASYEWADNLLVGYEDFFDWDDSDNIWTAYDEAKDFLAYAFKTGEKVVNITFSGSKGFGITLERNMPPETLGVQNTQSRVTTITNSRKLYIAALPRKYKTLDTPITIDPLRIRRLPGSIHSGTGKKCVLLDYETFLTLSPERLRELSSPLTPVTPRQTADDTTPRLTTNVAVRPGVSPATKLFISTRDVNTNDRVIALLVYPHESHRDAHHIQSLYNLGTLWWFYEASTGRHYYASETTHQRRRAEKAVIRSRALNKTALMRYGEDYLPLDVTAKGKLLGRSTAPESTAHIAHFKTIAFNDPIHWKMTSKKLRLTQQTFQIK